MISNNFSEVRVFAPASVANVGCGFDVLGFAIHEPGDEIVARVRDEAGVAITAIHGDGGKLPLNIDKNTAGVAATAMLQDLSDDISFGIELELHKKMPLGSGLGSSAASSVAAVVAVNRLLGDPFDRKDLLKYAVEGERVACGAAHADNAAASLLGGFVFIRSNHPIDVIPIDYPDGLHCTVIHPQIVIRTEDTRKILRKQILLARAVAQWGNVGALVAGLMKGDYDLIGRSLHDEIIEPIRSVLIPGFNQMKSAAMDAGALGCSISGSGPSVFALSTSNEEAEKIGAAMQRAVASVGLTSDLYISEINKAGCTVISEEQLA